MRDGRGGWDAAQPDFETTTRCSPSREQETHFIMSTTVLPSSLANPHGSNLVELTLVWGAGRDACVVASKRCKVGERVVLGEGGTFEIPADVLGASSVVIDAAPLAAPLRYGAFSVFAREIEGESFRPGLESLTTGALPQIAGSAIVHGLLVAAFAFFMPAMSDAAEEGVSRDQLLSMRALLHAAAERDMTPPEETSAQADNAMAGEHSGGQRAEKTEGAMGRTDAPRESKGRWTAAGDARPEDAQLAKERALKDAANFGMIGLLAGSSAADPNAPIVPWDKQYVGSDKESHSGNLLWGDPGDVFGYGVGLSGTGEGGGGKGEGIGVNDVGGLGRSLDNRIGSGTCVGPYCQGHGSSPSRGGHVPTGPSLRHPIDIETGGRIPAEVVQREVRLHSGRFQSCYADGLRTNPSLNGRVEVRFVIGRDGSVQMAQDGGGSDLPDMAVRQCVVKAFYGLSFPTPNGTVNVTYPLTFTPAQ